MKSRKKKYENHYATILSWARNDAINGTTSILKPPGKAAGRNDDPDKFIKGKFGHMVRR